MNPKIALLGGFKREEIQPTSNQVYKYLLLEGN